MTDIINEECYHCSTQFQDIEEVHLDVDNDNYVCKECGTNKGLTIVPCTDI